MDHNILQLTDSQFNTIINQHTLVLVGFWAPWCGPCQKLGPVIEQLAVLYQGKVIIGKLNIDDNPKMPSKYMIRTIPTMLIFHKGQQVDRLVGNLPIAEMQIALDKHLH